MREIYFQKKPVTLIGREISVGKTAPDFRVVSQDLKDVRMADFKDKVKIITSFLSLDTSVCERQVVEFNERAGGLSDDVVILAVSKDLPYAQKNFCQGHKINKAVVLSDYHYSSFGLNYGVLIKELGLLARAVFIVDKQNTVRYLQVVQDTSQSPDFEAVFRELTKVLKQPSAAPGGKPPGPCVPCEGGVKPLSPEQIQPYLEKLKGWDLIEGKKIQKDFKFKDFVEAKYFVDLIALLAEDQQHHPSLTLDYNKLKVTLWTHAVNGLSDKDFILASAIDGLM